MMAEKKKLFKGLGLNASQINSILKKVSEYDQEIEMLYDILGKLHSKIQFDKIMNDLVKENFGINKWESSSYDKYRENRAKKDKLASYKIDVREGEIECSKCKQKKTIVVEMQNRSCDEGYSYQIHCLNEKCGMIKTTDNF